MQNFLYKLIFLLVASLALTKIISHLPLISDYLEKVDDDWITLCIALVLLLLYVALRWRKRRPSTVSFPRTRTPQVFPLISACEGMPPLLLTSPEDAEELLYVLKGATLYTRDMVYPVADVCETGELAVALGEAELQDIVQLKGLLETCIRRDDDVMTQYRESGELISLLDSCQGFEEIVAWGCLTGALSPMTKAGIAAMPELMEDTDIPITPEQIRSVAATISFATLPDILPA